MKLKDIKCDVVENEVGVLRAVLHGGMLSEPGEYFNTGPLEEYKPRPDLKFKITFEPSDQVNLFSLEPGDKFQIDESSYVFVIPTSGRQAHCVCLETHKVCVYNPDQLVRRIR